MKFCSMILVSTVALGQSFSFSGATRTRVWNNLERCPSILSFCSIVPSRSSSVRRAAYANNNISRQTYGSRSSPSLWQIGLLQDTNDSIQHLTFQRYHKTDNSKIFLKRNTYLRMSSTDITSSSDVELNLKDVEQRIRTVMDECSDEKDDRRRNVRLIAVSKTKPIEMIKDAYKAGQRYFGENYAQELISKAEELHSTSEYSDICWHFIGPLQSNKASSLVKKVGKQLTCIETVSTIKLANKLNNAVESLEIDDYKLNIYLQVNTSSEESKSGLLPNEIGDLAKEIQDTCPYLVIKGVMTIGAPGDYNCFDILVECSNQLAVALNIDDPTTLELSMGMSNDFEEAIKRGSTNVRIGSTIFGARDYSNVNK